MLVLKSEVKQEIWRHDPAGRREDVVIFQGGVNWTKTLLTHKALAMQVAYTDKLFVCVTHSVGAVVIGGEEGHQFLVSD